MSVRGYDDAAVREAVDLEELLQDTAMLVTAGLAIARGGGKEDAVREVCEAHDISEAGARNRVESHEWIIRDMIARQLLEHDDPEEAADLYTRCLAARLAEHLDPLHGFPEGFWYLGKHLIADGQSQEEQT